MKAISDANKGRDELPTRFKDVVADIKSLKIQGAQRIAKEAASSLQYILIDSKKKNEDSSTILKRILSAKEELFAARPTEPALRNSLNFILREKKNLTAMRSHDLLNKINSRINETLSYFEESDKAISEFASKKIRNGMTIFTHCHSSTVTHALIDAHNKKKKKFSVRNTETRPLYQGRITAAELANAGIPVTHYVDSGARIALKDADLFFIGADAITAEGCVINKIGSELFSKVANEYNIPVYVLTHSWKFDPQTVSGIEEPIEERKTDEVWIDPPKGVKIHNYAFERIHPKLITGIISELGIHPPTAFAKVLGEKQRWMFEKR